ncbi:MAG: glutamate synthase subunit alpha, partial [Clostridiales bacterium]|nr:glutamate synthase subunit alpha [Clostridiales bacterium]
MSQMKEHPGLACPDDHDACGIGAVISIDGVPSHSIVSDALTIVEKLEHRAGKDATGEIGDGVGIMLQISHRFFSKEGARLGLDLGQARDYGVGMFFFPVDSLPRHQAQKMFEVICAKEGVEFLGWRDVPIDEQVLSEKARSSTPYISQCFVRRPATLAQGLEFDRKLYIIRRVFEQSNDNTYVVSFSSRTIVYKGMFLVNQLRRFYPDLLDEDYESALAMVHSRFSTNTTPSWRRAHPNRFILHNGEINSIRGNADRMLAREETMYTAAFQEEDLSKVLPVVSQEGSDSAMLDNTLEFLVMSGMELPKAVMITIPEPWENNHNMSMKKKDFYQYYATMMEPWDGPAAILFSDGDMMGAVLDRNGLRPSRYYITDDNRLILSSEVGVLEVDPAHVVKKSRLAPSKMLLVDLKQGRVIDDDEIKERYAGQQPYGQWLYQELVCLKDLPIPNKSVERYTPEERYRLMKAFGYTFENIKTAILPMALTGAEPTASMGIDTPLAVLSERHQPLFNYFKQLFAQVTNPPLDCIREEIITSTTVYMGKDGNLLQESAKNCHVLRVHNPILTDLDLLKIKHMKKKGFKVETISILYYKSTSLEKALDHLMVRVDRAYRNNVNYIILSDRGVDENHVAIPSLLAVSAVSKYLIRTKKGTAVALILESAEPREVHHFATLLGYGASAINPYLALDCIQELIDEGMLDKDYYAACNDYNSAVIHGIVKIAAKMGVSTIQSYAGSQLFEAVGINKEVIDQYFTNTVSRVGGIGLKEIEQDVEQLHSEAFDPLGLYTDPTINSGGTHQYRSGKEEHLYSPMTIHLLQNATQTGSYEKFKEYTHLVEDQDNVRTLRGCFDFRYPEDGGIPIDQVEPVENIVKRFKTGAMSYGSISQEAHECMALAMNALGGKSNTGEGGEGVERLHSERCSAIKQVASGRFGVTSEYLVNAQ